MILFDSGAICALNDKRDQHYKTALSFYESMLVAKENFAITQLIMAETWWLVNRRKNLYYADKVWAILMRGAFHILELDMIDLGLAYKICSKYSDSGLSFVDATSLATCERYRISEVFTFDRGHFGLYRPGFVERLRILPEV